MGAAHKRCAQPLLCPATALPLSPHDGDGRRCAEAVRSVQAASAHLAADAFARFNIRASHESPTITLSLFGISRDVLQYQDSAKVRVLLVVTTRELWGGKGKATVNETPQNADSFGGFNTRTL